MIGANGPHIFSPFRIVIVDRIFCLDAFNMQITKKGRRGKKLR